MKAKSFDLLKPDLISLGFAYAGEASRAAPDPEKVIIQVVKLFQEDQKLYRMFLAWMDRFGDLIHVERLSHHLDTLSVPDRIILGVTALKRVNAGDARFKVLHEKIRKQNLVLDSSLSGQDPYLIEKHGLDMEADTFGIKTAKILPSENKKILNRRFVLRTNFWLRLRALLGANYRADVAFVRLSHMASNAYVAMKLLGCSKETSYRIWGNLQDAEVESIIQHRNSAA